MNINFNIPQVGAQPNRTQPVVIGDRSPNALSAAAAPAKRLDLTRTTATFSSESLKLAEEALSIDKPESIKNYLSNFDFENISPSDFTDVASKLYESGVIDRQLAGSLMGTEIAYEVPLDRNKPTDITKIFEDRLAANIAAGPNGGRETETRARDFVKRLADFATSNRETI